MEEYLVQAKELVENFFEKTPNTTPIKWKKRGKYWTRLNKEEIFLFFLERKSNYRVIQLKNI
jgi:hypothetical protein